MTIRWICFSVLAILLSSCNLPDLITDEWTVTGDVVFQGVPAGPVKLACFYTYEYSFYSTSQGSVIYPTAISVSNVADLGTTGGNFTIDVSTKALDPSDGQYIYLIMWVDLNGNAKYDIAEDWNYVIPRYGDPVFQNAPECGYYFSDHYNDFMGTEPGWNQSIGFIDYKPVYFATMSGAKISNEYTWY